MSIGTRTPVVDAVARVTGALAFVQDLRRPGMLEACILRSPHAHAVLRVVDGRDAERHPGVAAVLTRDDIVGREEIMPTFGIFLRDQSAVATDVVRYAGEPVAAVAAIDRDAAESALARIDVVYEALPAVLSVDDALAPGAPILHPGPRHLGIPRPDMIARQPGFEGTNIVHLFTQRKGDIETAMASAEVVITNTYSSPAAHHVPLEAHGAVAEWAGDHLTIWSSSQAPHLIASELAAIFRLPVTNVRVIVGALGGGFGSKVDPSIEPIVALLARKARRPVRLVLERGEEFLTHTKHAVRATLTTGARRDGTLVAHRATCWYDGGAYAKSTPEKISRAYASMGPYRVPNVHVDSYGIYTNRVPAAGFRGFGIPQMAWAHESQMDALADALGLDPLELRLRNALIAGDVFSTGETLHEDLHYPELLRAAAARVGWVPGEPPERHGARVRAKGVAAIIKGMSAFPSSSVVRMNGDGSLHVMTSSVDMGQGVRTALAQIAADEATLPVDRVEISLPDTAVTPFDQMTAASRTTSSMGRAIRAAVRDVREQLLDLAAAQLEADRADLEIADGSVHVSGSPVTARPFGKLIGTARVGSLQGRGTFMASSGLSVESGQGIGSPQWHPCVCAAEVEVDEETGTVRILQLHLALYVGRMVNPTLCELQVEGAGLFGLGQALFEELSWDEAGSLMNGNLADYLVPSLRDLPVRLSQMILESPGAEAHGIGENGLPAVPPAIGNAVARAIGARIRDLPMTPERVLRIAREGRSAGPAPEE